jgi:N-methylhydantoinase B
VIVARQGGEYVSPHLSKDEDIRLVAGDTITVRTPGGGGYGNPWQREPALVARDVARGYFTAADAARDYGVVLTPDDPPALDRRATDELRRRGRPKGQ